tara:strand:- start:188 stop:439 length:252 start_codon:yes stop_codon:yes gene_type:complete
MSLPSQYQSQLEDVHETILENLESHNFIDPIFDIVDDGIEEAFSWADAKDYGFDKHDYLLVALKEIVLQIQHQVNLMTTTEEK